MAAIQEFRRRWINKSGNQSLANLSDQQLLTDTEAIIHDQLTYAALILFGTHAAPLGAGQWIFLLPDAAAAGRESLHYGHEGSQLGQGAVLF